MKYWLKFNAVGVAGIVVQVAALAFFKSGLQIQYLAATAMAVEIAVLHNFFWHEKWTWVDRTGSQRAGRFGRLVRFNLSNGALSILGNLVFMRLLVGRFKIPYLVGNLATIGVCSLLNFLIADRLVFRPSQS